MSDSKNYVCDGAQILCPLCSKPKGKIKVTSNQIKIQDKLSATAGDRTKLNLKFDGNCSKSLNSSSPCKTVISTGKWQKTAETFIQGEKALLESSTIKCNYGGIDIKIIDDTQKSQAKEPFNIAGGPFVNPKEDLKYTNLEWTDDNGEKITENSRHNAQTIELTTLNFLPGEIVTFKIKEKDNKPVQVNQEELVVTGVVDETGVVRVQLTNSNEDEVIKKEYQAPQIKEMYWTNEDGKKIQVTKDGEKIKLHLELINVEEGEEVCINLDNTEGERITIKGIADDKGMVIQNT